MKDEQKVHESYWEKEKLLKFEDYERNQALLDLFTPETVVLDVGCGDGAVSEYANKISNKVYGIDFSRTALVRAKERGIKVIQADIQGSIPIQSQTIDTVFFGDVIEHIYHPERALKEIHRVLKPKGKLILSCPNMGYWRYRLYYCWFGIFPETEWITGELWESQHIRFFNKPLILKLLQKEKFKTKEFIGISRRRLDQPLLSTMPSLFGMIMVITTTKA